MKLPSSLGWKLYFLHRWHRRHWWFAHYPDCPLFFPWMVRWGEWRLCLGCLLFWSGFVTQGATFLGLLFFWGTLPFFYHWIIGAGVVVLLSVLDIMISLPLLLHRLIRWAGGGATCVFFTWIFVPPLAMYKIPPLLLAWLAYHQLSQWRRKRMVDPCPSCPDYSLTKICPGFQERVEMERDYIKKANDLLYRKL